MKHTLLIAACALSLATLAACNKPEVIAVPSPPVAVPGPTGATGATGEAGKPGDNTTVIVLPPPAASAASQ
ncbi:MAG: hypothetical protein CFE45_21780 [Burkholderiales bacterium PBB5]|nr:MAG: hypothetical protein CFE45_21780 [Burkholderiales bacterium PBB5]